MANPTWQATPPSVGSAGSTISSTIVVPSGWTVGAIAYLAISQAGGQATTVTSTNGAHTWKTVPALQAWGGSTNRLTIYECTLAAADLGSTVTVTFGAVQLHVLAIVALSGHNGRDETGANVVKSTASTINTFAGAGVIPSVADCAVVYFNGSSLGANAATLTTSSVPTNYTEEIDVNTAAGTNAHPALSVGYRMLSGGAGATETPSDITLSQSARGHCLVLAIAGSVAPAVPLITPRTAPAPVVNASATTITGNLSSDIQTGDYVVAVCGGTSTGGAAWTAPAGWDVLVAPGVVTTDRLLAVYGKRDPGSGPVIAQSVAGRMTCETQAYRGVDPTTPLDATAVVTTAAATPVAIPTYSTVTANALVISACIADTSTGSLGKPVEQTLVQSNGADGVGRSTAFADETKVSAGATGTRTWTLSAGALGLRAATFALRPAPVVASPFPPRRRYHPSGAR